VLFQIFVLCTYILEKGKKNDSVMVDHGGSNLGKLRIWKSPIFSAKKSGNETFFPKKP